MSARRPPARDEIRLATADVALHPRMTLGLPAGTGKPGRLTVTSRALYLDLAGEPEPVVLPHAIMRRSLLRSVRYGLRSAYKRGVIEVPVPGTAPAFLAVQGDWDTAVDLHRNAVEAWSRYHRLRAERPPLRAMPGATEAEVGTRIERYLSWAGLVWGAGPNPPYRTSVAGFPVRLRPCESAVEIVVPVAHGVRPEELTDAQALPLASAAGALLRFVPDGDGWDLVATTVVPAAPLHIVDLDHAVKTTVARAMAAPTLGGHTARHGPPEPLPPVRRDTGDPLLDPTRERSFQRVLTSLEALDVPVDRYQWGSGIAHIAAGPLLVRLDASRTVPVISIDLLLGEVDPVTATAASVRRLLSPPDAAARVALRRGGDGLYLTRCAEVVLCETAHGNLRAVLADLYATHHLRLP